MNFSSTKYIDVVILCGGLGKRLSPITKDIPKPMVRIKNKPFLDILIQQVSLYGFRRFILCTGYKSEVIEDFYRNKDSKLEMVFSPEDQLLGTGGAVKNAENFIKSDIFLVMNGDSLCKMDLQKFLSFHIEKKALVSMALTEYKRINGVGWVILNDKCEIINFSEKTNKGPDAYMNAGVYFFNKKIFSYMPDKTGFSLEYDLFPKIVDKGIYGYITDAEFIDIGTYENYKKAKRLFNSGDMR